MTKTYDVVVVGGRFAGLSASIELSKHGINHCVIDPRPMDAPEDRSFTTSIDTCKEFGLTGRPIYGMCWLCKDHRFEIWIKRDKKRYPDPGGVVISGKESRKRLFNKCKCDFINERVVTAKRKDDGISVYTDKATEIWAPLVIDASGSGAIVATSLSYDIPLDRCFSCYGWKSNISMDELGWDNETMTICLGHFPYPPENPVMKMYTTPAIYPGEDNTTEMEVGYGYYNLMTRPDLNGSDMGFKKVKQLFETPWFGQVVHYWPGLSQKIVKNRLSDLYWGTTNWWTFDYPWTDNLLLAGNSVGQAALITGGGVWPALVYGRMCGEVARLAVEYNRYDADFLSIYKTMINQDPQFNRTWSKPVALMCHSLGSHALEMFARGSMINFFLDNFDQDEVIKMLWERKDLKKSMIHNAIGAGAPALTSQIAVEGIRLIRRILYNWNLDDLTPYVDIESNGEIKMYGAELRRLILK